MNAIKVLVKFTPHKPNVLVCGRTIRLFCRINDPQPIALRPKKPKATSSTSQYFVDLAHVEAIGGRGGDGCISFLHIWANENAGPDGGDGGNGGHVVFEASSCVKDLRNVPKVVRACHGERGFNRDCSGKSAKHEVVKVPLGTVVRNNMGVIVGDLNQPGTKFLAARGGAGGRGNHFFSSDTMQIPEVAELGAEGETFKYILEVKSMAHIGLVGMPNAGKSTLLRAISRARPKVAPYAFTTLKPHIGTVQYSDHEKIFVADLPGLVEGSHKNEGLGIEFLKHAERCRGLLFLIDLSVENPVQQYEILRYEVSQFSEELSRRPHVIAGNKIDLLEAQNNLQEFCSKVNQPVFGISAKTGKNLFELLSCVREMYDNTKEETY